MQKQKLRDSAKDLLLKGCYKMAMNQYARLIELGSQGFTQRQWAIINANHGICLQFQQQYAAALASITRAIKIDPTYEKAYYRRMQVLRQLGLIEQAVACIPNWLHNKQIDQLLQQIKEEYLNSLGIDQILEDLLEGKQQSGNFVKDSHSKFYQRLLEQMEGEEQQQEELRQVGEKVNRYYALLKKTENSIDSLQSFLSILHRLLVKKQEDPTKQKFVTTLLDQFWETFLQTAKPFVSLQHLAQDFKENQEYKLAQYAPLSPTTLQFLQNSILSSDIQNQQIFEPTIRLISNLTKSHPSLPLGDIIYETILKFINTLSHSLTHETLGWLKRSFLLIDLLIKFHLTHDPLVSFPQINLATLLYLRHYFITHSPEESQLEKSPLKQSNPAIVDFLDQNLSNFVVIIIFEPFLHRLDRTLLKSIIPSIEQQLAIMKQIKSAFKTDVKIIKNRMSNMEKQYELLYTCLLLRIDLTYTSTRIDINSLLSHKHNRQTLCDQSLSDLEITALLLLAYSDKRKIVDILSHPQSVTTILHQFMKNSFTQQLESVGIITSFVYTLVVNVEEELEGIYAKKMGVSREEIQKAKKIQGERVDPTLQQSLNEKRNSFKQYICKHWSELIPNFSTLLLKIKQQSCLIKWGKFLSQIAQIDPTRLQHSKTIEVMLQTHPHDKPTVGKLFSLLCKKINPQLIRFEQCQSVANVLIDNIETAEHELVIFESLLGLINLKSNPTNKLTIPMKKLQKCLFEQNRYILHATLELINNQLVDFSPEEIEFQRGKMKETIEKYITYFRGVVQEESEEEPPLADFSHPSRIYCTLLSLAIVMDLDGIEEFKDWERMQKSLLKIKTPRGITLFKTAIYLHMKKRIKSKWWLPFAKELEELKVADPQKWGKLKQYMNE